MSGTSSPIRSVRFGAWVSKNDNTVYQAATDGFIVGYGVAGAVVTDIFTDSSNPPTTKRTAFDIYGLNGFGNFSCPVRKNDYYKVVPTHQSDVIFWIPLENVWGLA